MKRSCVSRKASGDPGTPHDSGAAELTAAAAADDSGDELWDWDPVQDLGKQARAAKRKAGADVDALQPDEAEQGAPASGAGAPAAIRQPKKRKAAASRYACSCVTVCGYCKYNMRLLLPSYIIYNSY